MVTTSGAQTNLRMVNDQMCTQGERLSQASVKSLNRIFDMIMDDMIEYAQTQSERITSVNKRICEYKEYLQTLDDDLLSNIIDIYESGSSVFVTHPVDIDPIDGISLIHQYHNMLCGPPGTTNNYNLFAIPKGKYRFVLIAVPAQGTQIQQGGRG